MGRSSVVWFILFAATALAEESPSVSLDDLGTLIGREYLTRGNRVVHSFQGIPYAEPPSGVNRFQAPIPKAWSGEMNATSPGRTCLQPEHRQVTLHVQRHLLSINEAHRNNFSTADPEDCLTLNVYTPDLTHNASLPVLVYYHGGSFMIGSEISFRPDFFLDRDVVLVVPQYRLGPFGFLSMQNELIPGNAALLDAVEALRWVNKHINKFGGDKNRVTISGQSAGSSIANYLMLSPLTKGLLHGVIMNSGSAIASWAQDDAPVRETRRIASFANFTGCQDVDDESVSQCLIDLPPEDLMKAFTAYIDKGLYKAGLPVKSRPDEPAETNFMPENAADIAKKGSFNSVPLLVGVTKHDSMWIINLLHTYLKTSGLLNNEVFIREHLIDHMMLFDKMYDPVGVINDLVEHRYFSYVPPEKRGNFTEILAGILDYVNTFTMKAPALQMATFNTKADSYLYTFDYIGRLHVPTNGLNDTTSIFTEGATHTDDMIYLAPRVNATFTEAETAISHLMVDLWANFVTSGNPNEPKKLSIPYWPNYNSTDKYYYQINSVPKVKQDFTNEFTIAIQDSTRSSAAHLSSSIMSLLMLVAVSYF